MIVRELAEELAFRVSQFPVTALLGPRQVGKTTLAKEMLAQLGRPAVYLDLELPSDLAKLSYDPELFLQALAQQTVVLDEVQHLPGLFPLLRSLVDQHRVPGRFVLLGSASPALLKGSAESLAGRVSYLEMHPFHYRELAGVPFWQPWLWGGFPLAYLAPSDRARQLWLTDFIGTYLARDLPLLGLTAPPPLARRLLTMLANWQGGLLNYSELANSLGISQPSVRTYIDLMEQSFLLRRLLPYYANLGKRLVKTPKIYVRDSGLLHNLLGINSFEALMAHPVAGASWESYVVQETLTALPAGAQAFFYRTQDGAELDLVIELGGQVVLCLEAKLSNSPSLGKGNHSARQALGNPPLLVVTPGADDYQAQPGIWVCSLATLPSHLRQMLGR
jgi:uncharacterized protein